MEKIVYLLSNKDNIVNLNSDALLIPVKNLSTRSFFECTLDEIKEIKLKTNKEIYLLCDKIILESNRNKVTNIIKDLLDTADKIFFADFLYYMEALKLDSLEKLVFYSPTLALSIEDIKAWKKLGIDNIIISKEAEYTGYTSILNEIKNVNLGMLACGYPQIYYSRRKMLSSFKLEYPHIQFDIDFNLRIKEKTRDMKMPIYEDESGTFIFAGELFYPNLVLKEFKELGMTYFIIDPSFTKEQEKLIDIVRDGLNGIDSSNFIEEEHSSFMLYRKMVNNYDK